MYRVEINDTHTKIWGYAGEKWLGAGMFDTVLCFGDIYDELDKMFPCGIDNHQVSRNIIKSTCYKHNIRLNGEQQTKYEKQIFGIEEFGDTFLSVKKFFDTRNSLDIHNIKDFEELRSLFGLNVLPFVVGDQMTFDSISTLGGVMGAVIYYYSFKDYRLSRCRHCGKWFATKNLKTVYCNRISPCNGVTFDGKEKLKCNDMVKRMRRKLSEKYTDLKELLMISKNPKADILLEELENHYRLKDDYGYKRKPQSASEIIELYNCLWSDKFKLTRGKKQ